MPVSVAAPTADPVSVLVVIPKAGFWLIAPLDTSETCRPAAVPMTTSALSAMSPPPTVERAMLSFVEVSVPPTSRPPPACTVTVSVPGAVSAPSVSPPAVSVIVKSSPKPTANGVVSATPRKSSAISARSSTTWAGLARLRLPPAVSVASSPAARSVTERSPAALRTTSPLVLVTPAKVTTLPDALTFPPKDSEPPVRVPLLVRLAAPAPERVWPAKSIVAPLATRSSRPVKSPLMSIAPVKASVRSLPPPVSAEKVAADPLRLATAPSVTMSL